MGTRQYIGARYVPKFADPIEWSAEMSYEPLTVVTYLNASYTSKKPVPAGTAPTNKDYWALTANYNAQIEEYRQEIENVKLAFHNVKDFGAVGDGVTNDTGAFNRAFTAAGENGYVYVPYGEYVVDEYLDFGGVIRMDTGTRIFTPDGGELPKLNIVSGNTNNFSVYERVQFDMPVTIKENNVAAIASNKMWNGGGESEPFTRVGSLVNGSNKILLDNTADIYQGYGILCDATNWPDGKTRFNTMRVVSVENDGVIIGPAIGEGGEAESDYHWAYNDLLNVNFTFRPRIWRCFDFTGVMSDQNNNVDAINWARNDMVWSNGQPAIVYEADLITKNEPCAGTNSVIILATGQKHNSQPIICFSADMDVNDAFVGLATNHCTYGVLPRAKFPYIIPKAISSHTGDNTIFAGISTEGIKNHALATAALDPINEGAPVMVLEVPKGGSSVPLYVRTRDESGEETIVAHIDKNGGAYFASGVRVPGIHLTQDFGEGTVTPTHTFIVQDADGKQYYVPCMPV